MPRQRWTREHDLAVLYLKVKHEGRLARVHPDIQRLDKVMICSIDSILMRKRNFDSLDSSITGPALRNAAKLTKEIWAEYKRDPEGVLVEARMAYLSLVG